MIATLIPSADQIRWYAQSALNSFDTLDRDDAISYAVEELRQLLAYLDALDTAEDPVLVAGAGAIKPGVRLVLVAGDAQCGYSADLKDVRNRP